MRKLILILLTLFLSAGCVTINQGGRALSFEKSWTVLPFINNTETPYAAERAESLTETLLYAHGLQQLVQSTVIEPVKPEDMPGTDRGEQKQKAALEAARQRKITYALAGTVNEWRYKVGLDGEPVAGFTIQVIELSEGKVVWSGAASKSGWSRDSVSAVAQQVLERLISSMGIASK